MSTSPLAQAAFGARTKGSEITLRELAEAAGLEHGTINNVEEPEKRFGQVSASGSLRVLGVRAARTPHAAWRAAS